MLPTNNSPGGGLPSGVSPAAPYVNPYPPGYGRPPGDPGIANDIVPPANPTVPVNPIPSSLKAPSGTPGIPATTGQGNAPAPRPASPTTTTPKVPAPPATPKAPAVTPTTPIHSATTPGQSTAAIGTPVGYDISKGIDTSVDGLLPDNFDLNSLTSDQTIPDADAPTAQSVIDSAAANQQGTTPWDVTPEQTVAGQYASLMDKGNAAIQAAEEAVTRKYAASGGRNSAMANTAAAMAGSQVALQIATQDAATFAAAGQFNANAANDFAKQMNQFIDNAVLSKQNFDQGVSLLKDQTNENIKQLYAQVEANAATQSTNLKSTIASVQAQTNATLEQMDKTFAQNQAQAAQAQSYAQQNAWDNYGMQVRMSYLSSVNTQQMNLMQTIGEIRANPNINATQAASAVQDAVNQFNSFMNMNSAYYSALVPADSSSNYQQYNSDTWPGP